MTPSTHLLPSTSCRVAQFDSPGCTGLLAKLVNREQTKIRSGPQFCSPPLAPPFPAVRPSSRRGQVGAPPSLTRSAKCHSGSFKAGVAPSRIARQFGRCQSDAAEVRQHCRGTARRYLFLAEEEEAWPRLAELNEHPVVLPAGACLTRRALVGSAVSRANGNL